MTDTVNLGLPCIEGSQAQKHVTHNDALRILDTLVQLAVLDRDLTAPPGSPSEGQRWIVKTGATGLWAGHDNAVAAWQDGAWLFSPPKTGWMAFVVDEGTLLVWNGSAWGDFFSTVTSIQNLARLGLGTTADATNPLSGKLNNALFAAKTVAEGGDGNLRYTLSKESVAKSLSFLFQDNYSGRAEIGLTGDDDFHFKVSPDGSSWYEGIRIDRTTGKVSFPASGGPREVLTADRTYYVRTDGSDSNNGLANSSGGAFLTIQKAVDTIAKIDCAGFTPTIQVGAGTWSALVTLKDTIGGQPILLGDETTPANVTLSRSGVCILADGLNTLWKIRGLKLTTSGGGNHAIKLDNGARMTFQNLNFGSCGGYHIYAGVNCSVSSTGPYTISGGAPCHFAIFSSKIVLAASTITVTGTPAFSVAFVYAQDCGILNANSGSGVAFSGAATGSRYNIQYNSAVDTNGGGATFLPGSSAGTTSTGGQYS